MREIARGRCNPKIQVNFFIDPDLYDEVKAKAEDERRSMSFLWRQAMKDYLEREEERGGHE